MPVSASGVRPNVWSPARTVHDGVVYAARYVLRCPNRRVAWLGVRSSTSSERAPLLPSVLEP
ncbi:hypothetical protein GGQ04_003369 [Salinibacter ruber]|uniref:hypothetical protein n=1 Tax=Salinibacter ruber TaxID=146919 RepID=UPI002166F565|nr:hypothetical protein [Salinibacter ruber]MCS4048210.1 hypothetical protein [Salinibacter ruber]